MKMVQCWSLSLACSLLLAGCASNKTETKPQATAPEPAKTKGRYKDRQYAANPSKVKFGEFKLVELKETELAPQHANNKANQESARKIDEMLLSGLKSIWPDIKVIPKGGEFSKGGERTLQIEPKIEDIRLVSVGSRIWFGVMAGGSDIVMHVDYRDSSTGEIIANPDFWRGNNAWAGGYSWGAADNQIRDAVVGQIVTYTAGNK
jgi:hypothetical protein